MDYVVKASSLNLRSTAAVSNTNRIAVLPEGQPVEKLGEAADTNWWHISTSIDGVIVKGYVHSDYLTLKTSFQPAVSVTTISEVHLKKTNLVSKNQDSGRAYALNEPTQPKRTATTVAEKVRQIHTIISWLEVDLSARYLAGQGKTYCNIYAYDFCYLNNVYLPRVWWSSEALQKIKQGQPVLPLYDATIHELNVNSIHDWFSSHGAQFGWRRTFDIDELQSHANQGGVSIICAKRRDINRSGHICAVVPEQELLKAIRKKGLVTTPVQSQAGANNYKYVVKNWWHAKEGAYDKFSSFSFWMHD